MKREDSLKTRRGRTSGVSVMRVVGGATIVLAAVVVIALQRDIRRYWKMVRM
jgi:hypothetical protein